VSGGTSQKWTDVDDYWSHHTVNSKPFRTREESESYLEWRFAEYPLFCEFMNLYEGHDGHQLVDYGCGPGDDLVGYLIKSKVAHVTGLDVSAKALGLARGRLQLHGIDAARYSLINTSDGAITIPLDTASTDHVHCAGVLHHTTNPTGILREFARILRPRGTLTVMVYNRESIWYHLYTAYVKMVVEGAFAGLSMSQAFARNTDGEACPISRSYTSKEFLDHAAEAGFEGVYVGGYFSRHELEWLERYGADALRSAELGAEHRAFLRALQKDASGFPRYDGKHAGIGGVYRLGRSR
jgi:ubiquinone/menaquinone biosynthesis C-methylase UbiE